MKYFLLGITNAFFFVVGLWFGIVLTEVRLAQEPQIVYREMLPSPRVYWEGKRSEPGGLASETQAALTDPEHRQAIDGTFADKTNDLILKGPELPDGDNAPWRRAK